MNKIKNFLIRRKINIICSITALAAMWIVWIAAYYSVKNDYIIPSFTETVKSLFFCFAEKSFWTALGMTLLRTLAAFAVSFVFAAVCASVSACSKYFKAFIKPIMSFLRTLPTLAVMLILLIWTSAEAAPVTVTFLVLFPMIYSQFEGALGDVDCGIIEMSKVYGISRRERLFKIYLPSVAPNILAQTGADISLGLKIMISAEVLSNTCKSLGGLMQTARGFLEMPRLAALTLVAVIAGLIAELVFSQLDRFTRKWRQG